MPAFNDKNEQHRLISLSSDAKPYSGILITGCHRSGSTWVGGIISESHRIHYIQEPLHPRNVTNRWLWRHKVEHFYTHISEKNGNDWEPYYSRILNCRPYFLPSFKKDWSIKSSSASNYMSVFKEIARSARSRWQGRVPLLKDPYALLAAPWLAKRFNLAVVVLIRHPAAFVASLKRMGWDPDFDSFLAQPLLMSGVFKFYASQMQHISADDIVSRGALLWTMLHDVIHQYQKNHPDWLFIKHEDLSSQPLEGYREIFAFLGLKLDGRIQTLIKKLSSSKNPQSAPDGTSQALARDSAAVSKQWHKKLRVSEVELIRTLSRPVADKFYDLNSWNKGAEV